MIEFLVKQIEIMNDEMQDAEADGNSDYAYYFGAKEAFEFMLKKLVNGEVSATL
jgi:hypothetical protein